MNYTKRIIMKVLRSKYIFNNGIKEFEHYLYGIIDDSNLLIIVDEHGKDPHLVYHFRNNHGIWGALDELMNGHGEEISKEEYEKLVQKWINEYNEEQPRYYDPINDSYFRVHNKVKLKELNKYDCDAVVYSYDGVQDPQYVRPAEEFYKLCIKK